MKEFEREKEDIRTRLKVRPVAFFVNLGGY